MPIPVLATKQTEKLTKFSKFIIQFTNNTNRFYYATSKKIIIITGLSFITCTKNIHGYLIFVA